VVVAVGALALRTPLSPGGSSSPRASTAASLPPPALVERIAYTLQPRNRFAADPGTCDDYGESRLALVGPDGGDPVRVLQPGDLWETQPAWSPDGRSIAFVGLDADDLPSLYVVNADGTNLRNLIPVLPSGIDSAPSGMLRPAWSPDGLHLLFTYGDRGVWLVDADGNNIHQLIAPLPAPRVTADPQGNIPESFSPGFGSATWMPDGRIAVEVTQEKTDTPSRTMLYAAAADGTGLAPLPGMPSGLDVRSPAWSPDGRLSFVSFSPGATQDAQPVGDLYVLDAGAATPRKIPGSTGIRGGASWSPDGLRLAFASGSLYTVKADGTDRAEVPTTSNALACWADWGRSTAEALPRPSQPAAPGATAAAQPFHRGSLDPGTYVTDLFEPHMQFRVGGGWVGVGNYLDGLALGRPEIRFNEIDVGRVQVVFDSPCVNGSTSTIGPTAREFFDFIRKNPYLDAGDPRPVIIGGRTGLMMDVVVARTPGAKVCPDEPSPFQSRVFLFQIGETAYWFGDQHRVRIVSIDVGQGPAVTFVYGGDPAGADDFIKASQTVIDSLAFPGATP